MFKALGKESVRNIIKLLIKDVNERLKDKYIQLDFTGEAVDHIIDKSYDLTFGARPIKRYLQREVETNLAKLILKGDVAEGDTVTVSVREETLSFQVLKKDKISS